MHSLKFCAFSTRAFRSSGRLLRQHKHRHTSVPPNAQHRPRQHDCQAVRRRHRRIVTRIVDTINKHIIYADARTYPRARAKTKKRTNSTLMCSCEFVHFVELQFTLNEMISTIYAFSTHAPSQWKTDPCQYARRRFRALMIRGPVNVL